LRQQGASIAIRRHVVDKLGKVAQPWFEVGHIFDAGKRVFVTNTPGKQNVEVYIDGVLAEKSSDAGIISRELTGLVLGNSTMDDSAQVR